MGQMGRSGQTRSTGKPFRNPQSEIQIQLLVSFLFPRRFLIVKHRVLNLVTAFGLECMDSFVMALAAP
jgi:hypothetical protein